jgi:hypothetical protein
MTLTMTMNDHLVELGTLVGNEDRAAQRVGARLVDEFLASDATKQSDEVIVNVLYYLTDIQVRDYALGLLDPSTPDKFKPALSVLLEAAPTDTDYINAPACLLAALEYEQDNKEDALIMLSNADENYSLAILLSRVFAAGWPKEAFGNMRAELHPQVVAGIFGEEDDDYND